jgi:hypothetical protein
MDSYTTSIESAAQGRVRKITFDQDGERLSFGDTLALLRDSQNFRQELTVALAEAPYRAFHWEAPPVTRDTLQQDFECVLVDSPDLTDDADPRAFAGHFDDSGPDDDVIVFPNLGDDALLVVPMPKRRDNLYAHLASFLRGAETAQVDALWQCVSDAMRDRLGTEPVWLNTAGGGVSWLHVRLDSRPKYYRYAAYRHWN